MPFSEPSDEQLRSTFWDLVVIGRGFSAIVNCVTRQSVGNLPEKTLLLGAPDPWRTYFPHRMGQFPALLALPGFCERAQHRKEDPDDFLLSRKFGLATRRHTLRLLRAGLFQVNGMVEGPLSHLQGKWMIPVRRGGENVTLSARNVDICTGPGPGRIFHPDGEKVSGPWRAGIREAFAVELLQELYDNVGDRVLIAEDFMRRKSLQGRVIVVGEGPLAASAVEHALLIGTESVLWVGRPLEMAQVSFPVSERYDHLIADAANVRLAYEQIVKAFEDGKPPSVMDFVNPMKPTNPRLSIFLGAIGGVQPKMANLVAQPPHNGIEVTSASIKEFDASTQIPVYFDTLVISASSENSESERRSAAHLLQSIPKGLTGDRPLIPIVANKMLAGLCTPDRSLRVLGAPSRNGYLMTKSRLRNSEADDEYRRWYKTLPKQTSMPNFTMGITVAAATISMANDFYCDTSPDTCAQTASLPEGILLQKRKGSVGPLKDGDPDIGGFTVFPRTK